MSAPDVPPCARACAGDAIASRGRPGEGDDTAAAPHDGPPPPRVCCCLHYGDAVGDASLPRPRLLAPQQHELLSHEGYHVPFDAGGDAFAEMRRDAALPAPVAPPEARRVIATTPPPKLKSAPPRVRAGPLPSTRVTGRARRFFFDASGRRCALPPLRETKAFVPPPELRASLVAPSPPLPSPSPSPTAMFIGVGGLGGAVAVAL